mmetsp:Transcript_29051/g.51067  ORF Transcript_29051/g.51067 Transcript_29051/m.51067 type:complete len:209 (-) Transcript_29051:26-652(-)
MEPKLSLRVEVASSKVKLETTPSNTLFVYEWSFPSFITYTTESPSASTNESPPYPMRIASFILIDGAAFSSTASTSTGSIGAGVGGSSSSTASSSPSTYSGGEPISLLTQRPSWARATPPATKRVRSSAPAKAFAFHRREGTPAPARLALCVGENIPASGCKKKAMEKKKSENQSLQTKKRNLYSYTHTKTRFQTNPPRILAAIYKHY